MLNQGETIDILNRSEYGILSTVGKDNAPYGVPLNFAYVEGVIYFHCAKANGYKIINIINNSNACFTVVDDVCLQPEILSTKYKSAILFGKISIVEDIEEKKKGLEALIKKLSPEYMEVGMKCIDKNTDKDHINVYKSAFDYHWNNYILNDNKASLAWLVSNGKEMEVKDLLFCFGYDKDAKLNKLILDSISNNANDRYSIESLEQVFAGRDLNGKLQIHENLLKFIQENPTNDYVKMLDIYGNYCLGEKTDCKFTRDESFKIAAYITYYLKLIDLENDKRSGSDEYLIINDMLFRIIGALEDKEGNQRDDEGEDSKFLKEIIKNDYYNLPNFKEMVYGLVNDYRNIGYSSEAVD